MEFKALVVFLTFIVIIGVYTIYTGGTIASVCRVAGNAVVSISIDDHDTGILPGVRAWVGGVGRSITDSCSGR